MLSPVFDHLVDAFIHLVDQYEQQAKLSARDEAQRAQTEAGEDLKAAGHVLNLFIDDSIPDDATFAAVKARAFSLLEAKRFPVVSAYMRSIEFDRTAFEWAYYAKLSPTFKRNLRTLDFLIVHLASNVSSMRCYINVLEIVCRLKIRHCNRKMGMTPLASLSTKINEEKRCHASTIITTYSTRCNPNQRTGQCLS